jgi:hypothetical protein
LPIFLTPPFPTYGLLLHGNNLDELIVIGLIAYLLVMFILSRRRARQLKRRKLQNPTLKEKTLPVEEGSNSNKPS